MDENEPRIKKARRPSKEELRQLVESTPTEFFPRFARLMLVPENPSRQAYTVFRDIYLAALDDWWSDLVGIVQRTSSSKEQVKELFDGSMGKMDKMTELQSWLRPPEQPMSLEDAAKLIEGAKSDFWRQSVMRGAGKRRRPGQPASKRYLALRALDIKCAYPDTSLREATNILCPCGKDEHTPQCREQLRQQINRLVKILREYGYDFTWERIKTEGWKVLLG